MILVQNIIIGIYLAFTTFLNIIVPISGSAIVTSVLAILTTPQKAIGIAAFFFFTSGIFRIWIFRKEIIWEEIKILLPLSLFAALFGIYFSLSINPIFLIILILIFISYFFIKKLKLCYLSVNQKTKNINLLPLLQVYYQDFFKAQD